jgi:hypothetical protein
MVRAKVASSTSSERSRIVQAPEPAGALPESGSASAPAERFLFAPATGKCAEIAAVVRALCPALGLRAVEDLAELLEHACVAERLLLDADRVPPEDIGLLRRFLKRAGASVELHVTGADPSSPVARSLLALPGAAWLFWPPDLEQLRRLAGSGAAAPAETTSAPGSDAAHQPGPVALGEHSRRDALATAGRLQFTLSALEQRREAGAGEESPGGVEAAQSELARLLELVGLGGSGGDGALSTFDLGELVEELLAELTVRGARPQRLLWRRSGDLLLRSERPALRDLLAELFEFARSRARDGHVVWVRAESGSGDLVDPRSRLALSVDFPAGEGSGSGPLQELALGLERLGARVIPVLAPEGRTVVRLELPRSKIPE